MERYIVERVGATGTREHVCADRADMGMKVLEIQTVFPQDRIFLRVQSEHGEIRREYEPTRP